jgi:hypothetical protein
VYARRFTSRRTGLSIAAVLAILGMAAMASLGARPPQPGLSPPVELALPDTLSFLVAYAGTGAEGADMIWRGRISAPAAGQVTVRIAYAGAAADRGMPVWPVNAWLFFSADDYRTSFAAELSGSMNWRTGDMRVTGLVSDGHQRDSPVEQRMRVRRPELAGIGTVIFLSRIAVGPGILRAGSPD